MVREELTPREHDLLCSLATGESDAQAALPLANRPKTVITHRHRLYQRLDVHDRQQAVLRGFTLGHLNVLDLPGWPLVGSTDGLGASPMSLYAPLTHDVKDHRLLRRDEKKPRELLCREQDKPHHIKYPG